MPVKARVERGLARSLTIFWIILLGTIYPSGFANGLDKNPQYDPTRLLIKASIEGNIEMASTALKHGADVKASLMGLSPLYFASGRGHTDVVN